MTENLAMHLNLITHVYIMVLSEDFRKLNNNHCRFGYYVMTAMTQQKFTSTFLAKNVVTAVHIILVL